MLPQLFQGFFGEFYCFKSILKSKYSLYNKAAVKVVIVYRVFSVWFR